MSGSVGMLLLGAGVLCLIVITMLVIFRRRSSNNEMPIRGLFCINGDSLTLQDEHLQFHEFKIFDIIEIDGFKYLLINSVTSDSGEITIMKFHEDALTTIKDEDEFHKIAELVEDKLHSH